MELFWWAITLLLMALGIIGTVLPVVPGTAIILGAAVLHRVMLGPAAKRRLVDARFARSARALLLRDRFRRRPRWRAAIRSDALGNVWRLRRRDRRVFFSLPGLLLGPIIGAVAGELIGGKRLVDAGRAGWGTLLGNLAALRRQNS